MDKTAADLSQDIINKVLLTIFGKSFTLTKNAILEKIAFDVKLPVMVNDSTTGEATWAESMNPTKFITQSNSEKHDVWMLEKRDFTSIDDLIAIWQEVNFTTTERNYNSTNVFESDTIYNSENVIRSANCDHCKNILFCDGCQSCEYTIASQRSGSSTFCLRADDSANCTNSYNVICSGKISNSFFIQDCANLHECIFCSHITDKRYCISNMQFEKSEYFVLKNQILDWIIEQLTD